MILPLYAALEKIDPRLIEAASDLYASPQTAFRKVTWPLSMPGVVAGTLLTFIPAAGDYINAELLGSPKNRMIGNEIQANFIEYRDYPTAECAVVHPHGDHPGAGVHLYPASRDGGPGLMKWLRKNLVGIIAILVLVYLFIPIVVIMVLSFNNPKGKFNLSWNEFSLDAWTDLCGVPGVCSSFVTSIEIGLIATLFATILGTMISFALVRYRFRGRSTTNLLIFLPMATPEVVMGAACWRCSST